jgi:hypothetical protein
MFATLLRRWRLATPLALIGMVSILVGAMALTPASAHSSPKLDGWAAGARYTIDTLFSVTTASAAACWTGKVSTRHSTQVGPITSGEPVVLSSTLVASGTDIQAKVVEFSKCGSEVKTSSKAKTSIAVATLFGFESAEGITVFDFSAPPFAAELINMTEDNSLNNQAELSTTSEAHCVKGAAVLTTSVVENSHTGTIDVFSNGSNSPVFNDLNLGQNQVLSGLASTGYTAVLDEVTTTSNSITTIGLHITGNGVDVRLAESHASAHC